MAEGTPRDARVQRRGDPKNLGAPVPRRVLQILGGLDQPRVTSGSGRLELAAWLAGPDNPLTARVLVNRVWQHHFGAGIVGTPSNFGKQGRPPSHPELLDYLAARLVEDGWSIKALHRRILRSRVYQLAGAGNPAAAERDPDNVWLAHFERRRLDAETIRDAILAVSGGLDRSPGGPHPFPPQKDWLFTQHKPFQAVYPTPRRSIYLMTQRTRRHPYLALFDGPDPNSSTDRRNVTTVPTQALFFLNNSFVHEQALRFADRLLAEAGTDRDRAERAHRLALGRPATPEESAAAEAAIPELLALQPAEAAADQRLRAAWAGYARILFASNEFVYID
jgi:hypothetical protein